MAKPYRDPKKKRTEQKMTRLSKSELRIVEKRADDAGMSVAAYLRKQALA